MNQTSFQNWEEIKHLQDRINAEVRIPKFVSDLRTQYRVLLWLPAQHACEVRLPIGSGRVKHILLLVESNLFKALIARPRR
jgi:hypothetical protein